MVKIESSQDFKLVKIHICVLQQLYQDYSHTENQINRRPGRFMDQYSSKMMKKLGNSCSHYDTTHRSDK